MPSPLPPVLQPAEVADDAAQLDGDVDLARAGDAEAFGRLFESCHPHVFRFLMRLTRSEVLAEDLTAEAFLRALRKVRSFRGGGSAFRSWVIVIARNLAMDHFGSGRHRLEHARDDVEEHVGRVAGSDTAVVAGVTTSLLMEALDQVTPAQREVVIGRFLQELSISELAAQTGRTEGSVKQLQWRGLRRLAKVLSEDAWV